MPSQLEFRIFVRGVAASAQDVGARTIAGPLGRKAPFVAAVREREMRFL